MPDGLKQQFENIVVHLGTGVESKTQRASRSLHEALSAPGDVLIFWTAQTVPSEILV